MATRTSPVKKLLATVIQGLGGEQAELLCSWPEDTWMHPRIPAWLKRLVPKIEKINTESLRMILKQATHRDSRTAPVMLTLGEIDALVYNAFPMAKFLGKGTVRYAYALPNPPGEAGAVIKIGYVLCPVSGFEREIYEVALNDKLDESLAMLWISTANVNVMERMLTGDPYEIMADLGADELRLDQKKMDKMIFALQLYDDHENNIGYRLQEIKDYYGFKTAKLQTVLLDYAEGPDQKSSLNLRRDWRRNPISMGYIAWTSNPDGPCACGESAQEIVQELRANCPGETIFVGVALPWMVPNLWPR